MRDPALSLELRKLCPSPLDSAGTSEYAMPAGEAEIGADPS
jgi:hypothetical protein